MTIKIVRDKWGNLFAFNGYYPLFQFLYQKEENRWLFWLRGHLDPAVFGGKDFPMDFFKSACRAKFFIMFSEGDNNEATTRNTLTIPRDVDISEGMEYIEKYIRK